MQTNLSQIITLSLWSDISYRGISSAFFEKKNLISENLLNFFNNPRSFEIIVSDFVINIGPTDSLASSEDRTSGAHLLIGFTRVKGMDK